MIVIQKIQSSLQTDNALLTCLSGKLLCNLLMQLVNLTYMSMFSHSQKNFSQNLINQSSNMIVRLQIVLFALLVQCPAKQDVCPPWSIPDNSSNTGCSCGVAFYEEIKCSSKHTLLYFRFCMTYENETTECAKCPYAAEYPTADQVYIKLPQNVSLLNDFMFGPLNREGTLCSRCKLEYGPALYSYTLQCERCWDHGYGWALYKHLLSLQPVLITQLLIHYKLDSLFPAPCLDLAAVGKDPGCKIKVDSLISTTSLLL